MVNVTYSDICPIYWAANALPEVSWLQLRTWTHHIAGVRGCSLPFGHSIVSDGIEATDNFGAVTSEQTLAESFFQTPEVFKAQAPMDCCGI